MNDFSIDSVIVINILKLGSIGRRLIIYNIVNFIEISSTNLFQARFTILIVLCSGYAKRQLGTLTKRYARFIQLKSGSMFFHNTSPRIQKPQISSHLNSNWEALQQQLEKFY